MPLTDQLDETNLHKIYTNFDERVIERELKKAYEDDPACHLRIPKIIRHIVRKQGLAQAQLQRLYQDLLSVAMSENTTTLILLSQILKYAIRHRTHFDVLQLIDAFHRVDNEIGVLARQRRNIAKWLFLVRCLWGNIQHTFRFYTFFLSRCMTLA